MSEPTEQELREQLKRAVRSVSRLSMAYGADSLLLLAMIARRDGLTRQLNALLEAKAKETK